MGPQITDPPGRVYAVEELPGGRPIAGDGHRQQDHREQDEGQQDVEYVGPQRRAHGLLRDGEKKL
ncbi:MAG TPA: hypothetical protein PKK12_04765, partial [Candidatus Aminicenantes bacterium]|nr:hypothetical protein [Candidatus Aminicenantes bacterium]